MRRALLSKNKLKFIDGGIKRPKRDDPLFDSWERCNMMVLSWIIKTLSQQIGECVIYVEDAKELWEELKERCDLSKIFHKYREIEHVVCFLRGLNDSYNSVRTQILLMEPLPSINRVFSLIIQQERQERHDSRFNNQNTEIKVLANTTDKQNQWRNDQTWKPNGRANGPRNQGRGRGRNSNNEKQCSYCHKMNHTADKCYSKHGYPPWYKRGDNNNQKKGGQNEWNSVNSSSVESHPKSAQISTNSAPNTFTSEQMQKILQMIEKADNPSHSISQIQRNTIEDK
ncbi:uncharacterized protein LOC111240719 [Vigna radiata var. radiata]|uniref:Uncharacterized protein LOC111240719 n=1 Tax=Vigna radiata var. radiata TaxID=3916 RepID=A0A3Q0EP40_VIGRR|nr:uncharacterized protein LOC111240719 [Vigna radiata var. radiata]